MKHKICISMDEETLVKVKANLLNRQFRNKSHLIEYAVEEFLKK